MVSAPPITDVVTAYAQDVVDGRYLVGRWVRLACERHLRDLETGAARGLTFDVAAANRAIRFYANLRLPDGAGAGGPFTLLPWQCFVVGSLFGWKLGAVRRYRFAYIEVARANGKTPLLAGTSLYMLTADGQQGAQVYSAATTRDQAKICWEDAARMVRDTEALAKAVKRWNTQNTLEYERLGSRYRPLSADAGTMDGLRVHFAGIDELHEHPNSGVVDKLRTGMKTPQALMMMITTAGYDRHSVCWAEHEYTEKVLQGVVDDDRRFGYMATLDDGDDWTDEAVWVKANPSLGVTVRLEDLRQECEMAKSVPAQQNVFKRLRLNVWTEQATRWLDMSVWNEQPPRRTPEQLAGATAYVGVDLSSKLDLTAVVFVFPDAEGGIDVFPFFFVPEDNIEQRARRDRVPYPQWVDEGHLLATPGNVVDYGFIKALVLAAKEHLGFPFDIAEVAFDPWNAAALEADLQNEGLTVVEVSQNFGYMNDPSKEIERLLLARKLRHGGNPVLAWNASNVAVKQDPSGNIRPDKEKSTEKIDGMVALIMAEGRAMVGRDDGYSMYNDEELFIL